MHTLVVIALVLLVCGGAGFVWPTYRAYGWGGVGVALILCCVLFLDHSLVLR